MEYGWVMLIVLSVMGGIIAYLGDKIGSRVGKRKIKLFGLRPKYTSILVTILTGISIAVITLGVMSILSENVRIALFGMHQLQMQKAQLEAQRDELQQQAKDLGKELDDKNEEIRTTQLDLQQAQAARDDKARQLTVIQVAMDEAKKQRDSALADSEKARQDVAMLEETKQKMMGTIDVLDKRIKLLNETMTNIREGTVVFRVGEVLSSNVLNGGLSQANTMICRHLGVRDENTVLLYISPDEFNATVDALQKAGKSQKLLRIIAAGNIMLGEPALVHVEMYDNNLIYHRGDVVYEERLTAQELSGNAELQVMRFLHNVNQQAQAKGLLPDPLTGNVGALTAVEMFETINKIKNHSGADIVLKAVTEADTYTAGPLQIDIRVEADE